MIRIVICDDDKDERNEIRTRAMTYFDRSAQDYEIEVFEDAKDLLQSDKEFDLYLLDVLMPGCDGLTAAHSIRDKNANAIIVFITSNIDSAVEGYSVEASGFLLKPLSDESFKNTMDRLLKRGLIGKAPTLSVVSKHTPMEIPLSKIAYMESELHQVYIHTANETVVINQRLSALEERLSDYPEFLRCHQSFLVNLNYVDDVLDGGFKLRDVAVDGHGIIPISRPRYKFCKMEFYQFRLNRLR